MNLLPCCLDVVFDALIIERFFFRIENDKAGSRIVITRLSHGANIDHGLFITKLEMVITLFRGNKIAGLRENAWDVRVPLETVLFKAAHQYPHFVFLVDVFGKDVFIGWVAW